MHHLIFQTPEHAHEGEIPYARSGDLIETLLDFDSEDLALTRSSQSPESFLLQKACELRHWSLSGTYPRFYLEQHLEITLTGRNQAFCRILNARAHVRVSPLSLDALQRVIEAQLATVRAHQTDTHTFLKHLLGICALLEPDSSDTLELEAVFRLFAQKYPGTRREGFGLDLNRCLNSGHRRLQGHLLSVLPADKPQGFYVFDTAGTGQWIDRLTFAPARR